MVSKRGASVPPNSRPEPSIESEERGSKLKEPTKTRRPSTANILGTGWNFVCVARRSRRRDCGWAGLQGQASLQTHPDFTENADALHIRHEP